MRDFFGRERELEQLRGLGAGDVLCLLGPGGAGKTRLAFQSIEGEESLFVDLSSARSEADVVSVLANTLRAQVDSAGDHEALAVAIEARDIDVVIFDNLEQLSDEAIGFLGRIASDREFATIVTTRIRLGAPFDVVLEVGPLDVDAAVQVMVRKAMMFSSYLDDVTEDSPALRRICERLELLPLVVELAAGALRFMTVVELEAQMQREIEAASKSGTVRHRSLADSLAWSWDLLSDDGRAALTTAAAFAGGFHIDQFERASGWAAGRVRAALGELLDANLARHLADAELRRIAVYESARGYVGEVAPEAFARAQEAHAQTFTKLAAVRAAMIRTAEEPEAMAWVVRERDNIRSAWDYLLARKSPLLAELAVAIAEPLRRLGPMNLVETALAGAAELALELDDLEAFARLTLRRAHLVSLSYRDEESQALLGEIEERCDEIPADVRAEMLILSSLTPRPRSGEQPGDRLAALEEASALAKEAGAPWLELIARGMSATALLPLGREEEAFERLHDGLREAEKLGAPSLRLRLMLQLARMVRRDGHFEQARALVGQAAAQAALAHETIFELDAMLGKASLLYYSGEYEAAQQLYRETLKRSRQTATWAVFVTGSAGMAGIQLVQGDFEEVLQLMEGVERYNSSPFFSTMLMGLNLAAQGGLGRVRPDDERFDTVATDFATVGRRHAVEFADAFRLYARLGTSEDVAELREAETLARQYAAREDDPELSFVARGAVRLAEERIPAGGVLRIADDYSYLRFEQEDVAHIATRHVLKRLLERLVQHHQVGGDEGLDVYQLVEAGWPDEIIQPDAAATRLYTSIRYLRNMGLRDAIVRDEIGYLIDPTIRVELVDPEKFKSS